MAIQELEFAPEPAEGIDTWSRPRSVEERHSLLGRKIAELALRDADAEEDEDASLFDLMTV